jgi:hypothetical protein
VALFSLDRLHAAGIYQKANKERAVATVWTMSVLILLLSGVPAHAQYLELLREVADRQGVPDSLLLAVAWVESRGVLTALNIQGASYYPLTWAHGEMLIERHADSQALDVGVMQIGVSVWGRRWGVSAQALYPPQVNIPAGARILRQCIDDSGGDLWQGVGCYHSQNRRRQRQYVQRVWNAYTLLRRRGLLEPHLRCVSESEDSGSFGGTCSVPRRRPLRTRLQLAVNGAVPVRLVAAADRQSARLPQCSHQQPVLSHAGTTQPLLFFGPEHEGVEHWLAASGAAGVCVGCNLAEVYALQVRLRPTSVARATPGLIQQLGISCVPTLVQPVRQEQTGELP